MKNNVFFASLALVAMAALPALGTAQIVHRHRTTVVRHYPHRTVVVHHPRHHPVVVVRHHPVHHSRKKVIVVRHH